METEPEADLLGGEATGGTTAGNLTRAERVAKRLAGLDPMDIPLPPGSEHELIKVGSEDATRYGLEEDKHCVVTKVEDGDGTKYYLGIKTWTCPRPDATIAEWREPHNTSAGAPFSITFPVLPSAPKLADLWAPKLYGESKKVYQLGLADLLSAPVELSKKDTPERLQQDWTALLAQLKCMAVRAYFNNFARVAFDKVKDLITDGTSDARHIDVLRSWLEAIMITAAADLTEEMVMALALPTIPLLGTTYEFFRQALRDAKTEQSLMLSFAGLIPIPSDVTCPDLAGKSSIFYSCRPQGDEGAGEGAGGEGEEGQVERRCLLDEGAKEKGSLLACCIFQGVFVKQGQAYVERPGLEALADWKTASTKSKVGDGKEAAPSGKSLRVLPDLPAVGLKIKTPDGGELELSPVATAIIKMTYSQVLAAAKRLKALLPAGGRAEDSYPAEATILRQEQEAAKKAKRAKRRRAHGGTSDTAAEIDGLTAQINALEGRLEDREALMKLIITHMDTTAGGAHVKRVYAKLMEEGKMHPNFHEIPTPTKQKWAAGIMASYQRI